MTRVPLLAALALLAAPPAGAQAPPGPAGWVQAEAFYHRVTNGFGDWKGVGARLVAPAGSAGWYLEAQAQEAFRDRGVYGAVGLRQQLGAGWFTLLGAGAGTGEFALPDLRADWTLGKAWGRVVANAGATYVNAKRGFEDLAVRGGLALYFPGAVLEGGGRINWSWPEAVRSERGYGALTLGHERRRYVTLRASGGREGYQLTGVAATARRFRSYEGSVAWREWLGSGWGFVLQGVWYDNPFYTRTGASVGIFRHW